MRKEKKLVSLFRGLLALVSEEAEQNPAFASKIDALLSDLLEARPSEKKPVRQEQYVSPDIHLELSARGEEDFRIWLQDQPLTVIRAVIRDHDLDPKRRTSRWKDPEKLSAYVADGLRSRASRGLSFLGMANEGKTAAENE